MTKFADEAYQTDWHGRSISHEFPSTIDAGFCLFAWDLLVQHSAAAGRPGRVLDAACGDGRDIIALSQRGWEGVGLDASQLQLKDAESLAAEKGQRLHLVRGVAEFLPFRPGVFDSLICKSALDHFVHPDVVVRDIARVVHPNGRAVVSVNNYAGISTRVSRLMYRIARFVWPPARQRRFFFDTPVPFQHTYEATYDNTRALGATHFSTVDSYGVSMLWCIPGWGQLLSVLPNSVALLILRALNRLARYAPRAADVVVFVWSPNHAERSNVG